MIVSFKNSEARLISGDFDNFTPAVSSLTQAV
jgi:hypothetical protein